MTAEVDTPSAAVAKMAEAWPMIDALVGGTGAMRAAGELLMPRFPAEDPTAHTARVKMATLFPAFARTTEVLAAKPLSKAITLDDLPPEIEELLEDVDGEGSTLHAYAASLMLECLRPGIVGVLVDVPPAEGVRTAADEKAAGIRPYFATYKASSILGWRHERGQLTQLRLLECVIEEDGEWGEKEVRQVRVLTPGAWQVYRKVKIEGGREVWQVHVEGTTTLSRIPFVWFYGIREGFGIGKPPLIDLAFANVKHWQGQSDQDNILHVSRVPILFGKGFRDGEKIIIGASSAVLTTSEKAELKFVEHSGAAIDSGDKSLLRLEDQMRQTGAELLVQKPNVTTATQTVSEGEGSKSILQRITENFEESLEEALDLMCEWKGLNVGEIEVKLFKDFGATNLSDQSTSMLLTAVDRELVSKETAFQGLQRRDIIPAEVTWEDEQKRIAAQPKPEAPEMEAEDDTEEERHDADENAADGLKTE